MTQMHHAYRNNEVMSLGRNYGDKAGVRIARPKPLGTLCNKVRNVLAVGVDKYQLLEQSRGPERPRTFHYSRSSNFFALVFELLAPCGMISGARLRTSQAVGRCHRPLSSSVHYSLVIFDNGLNLSGESCV